MHDAFFLPCPTFSTIHVLFKSLSGSGLPLVFKNIKLLRKEIVQVCALEEKHLGSEKVAI